MALLTTKEKLENVQATIIRIETGAQSYSIGDRSKRDADLVVLYEREKELQAQYDAEQNISTRTNYASFKS
jgi:hypothetical protein